MARLRSYIAQATYQWIVDHHMTPYLLVNANNDSDLIVPEEYIEEGQILLNINPEAVRNFSIDIDAIRFEATFSTVAWEIVIPLSSILALYSHETGHGLYARSDELGLEIDEGGSQGEVNPDRQDDSAHSGTQGKKARLHLIK